MIRVISLERTLERRLAGQRLIKNDAKRVNIGGRPHRLGVAVELLRRHVCRGAHEHPALGQVQVFDVVRRARPKSMITGCFRGVIMMLAGFRSRWMTPLAWASCIASASCRTTATTARGGNGCPGRMNFRAAGPPSKPSTGKAHRRFRRNRGPGTGQGEKAWRRYGLGQKTIAEIELVRPAEVRNFNGD